MRVRYFIEFALEQDKKDGHHYYRPIGVWARGEGAWELTILYLPEEEMRWFDTQLAVCAFMERGDDHLPDDLLEGWITHVSLYTGDCSPIYETAAKNSEAVAMTILARITEGKTLADPPYPLSQPD
ncbi:MAG: hypothetical protein ACYDBB_01490 [Armatimonadota bacterium]